MKIAFQSSRYNGLTLAEELEFSLSNNVFNFDIFFDGFTPEEITEKENDLIRKLIDKGFVFSVHFPISDYMHFNTDVMKLINFANAINASHCTVHFDRLSYNCLYEIHDSLNHTTRLCIENTIPDTSKIYRTDYITFMKNIDRDKNIYSTFDTGHCHVNKFSMFQYIEQIISCTSIGTVHLHDNDGTQDAHLCIGKGNIDFTSVQKALRKHNQNPLFVIEHWKENTESLQNAQKIFKDL